MSPPPSTDGTPANAATAAARCVVDELARAGVRDLVLCPGSRSAPLAFAALAHEGLRLHTRVDERGAGFLALGIARTSRRPVAVVVTSGTAVANLHPAVLESSHSGVPLVLLTADRPAALRGTGANQTTWQADLFPRAVRAEADVAAPVPGRDEAGQVASWRSLTSRLVAAARGAGGAGPGPVQLNLQLDGPLVPDAPDGWTDPAHGRPGDAPWTTVDDGRAAGRGVGAAVDPAQVLAADRATVVVAGDDAGPPARVLAQARGWPLLAEPTSGSRTGPHAVRTYRLLLADPDLGGAVERVVVAGHPTLSRPVQRLLARADVEVVALRDAARGWTDPGHRVSRVLPALDLTSYAGAAGEEVPAPPGDGWLARWQRRDAEVSGALDALLDGWAPLTPHHVAGAVAGALPPGGLLFVGSSNPVRDLDLMVPRYRVGDRRMVLGNRGLAGIDGSVSTAVGAALGRPHSTRALALLGDLTFLHDLTGLLHGPEEDWPDLTVVVVNDGGGSIFATLEQGAPAHAAAYERLFGTPVGADLGALCRGAGVPHERVTDRDALASALARAPVGVEVVEAVVRRDDRRALDAAVRALVG